MKRVRLDFARPSLRRTLFHAPRWTWGLVLGALPLCFAVLVNVLNYGEAREEVEALQAALRARAGAPVAIPVDWNELNDLQDAHPFDIGDVEMLWERASKLKGWGFAAQALPDL